MADNVGITTGAQATVAAEDVGGVEYQRMKIVDGGSAGTLGVVATSAAPAAGSVGLVVRVAGSVSIAPTTLTVNTGPTTLTVNTATEGASRNVGSVASVAATAGTAPAAGSVGLVVALKGGASVTAQISAVTPTAGTPAAGLTGVPVWIVGGQTAAGGVTVLVGGTVTVQTIIAIASVGSISVLGTVGTVNSVSTIGVVNSVSAIGSINSVNFISSLGSLALLNTVGVVLGLNESLRTQFMLQVTSTIASNVNMLLFTAYLGITQAANTAGVSLLVVPNGQRIRIVDMQVVVAGSASQAIGQVQVVFATSAATVTISAIGARGPALAFASPTTVYNQFHDQPNNDIPSTQTIGIGISVNTSCLIGGIVLHGYMFP